MGWEEDRMLVREQVKKTERVNRWVCLCEMSVLWPQWRRDIQSCVCSFWISTNIISFLPSPYNPLIKVNLESNRKRVKNTFKNKEFAFRQLLINYRLKAIQIKLWEPVQHHPPKDKLVWSFFKHKHRQVTGNKENIQTGELLFCQVQVGALHSSGWLWWLMFCVSCIKSYWDEN